MMWQAFRKPSEKPNSICEKKANTFMELYLICLASALIGGLMLSRITKLMHLPAVTAYLVAGLMLGPFCLGALNIPGLGFQTLEQVEALKKSKVNLN